MPLSRSRSPALAVNTLATLSRYFVRYLEGERAMLLTLVLVCVAALVLLLSGTRSNRHNGARAKEEPVPTDTDPQN